MRVDIHEVIEESSIGSLHVLIVAIGFLIMIFDGYDLVAMAMIVPIISQEWAIPPSDFSPALSAALVGVLVGSSSAGMLGDWVGRRWTISAMLLIAGISMSITPLVTSMDELIAVRVITGIGAGGCIPVTLAYTAEFMPKRARNLLTVFMYSGAAMGTVIGGFIGPSLLNMGGWNYVFYFGGILPSLVVLVVIFALPESLRFLVNNNCKSAVAGNLLQRLSPNFCHKHENTYFDAQTAPQKGAPMKELFGDKKTNVTLLLWLSFFASQFLLFFVGLWMPTLLTNEGLTLETALYILAIYNLGGVLGGTSFGAIGDRVSPMLVLTVTFVLAAVFVFSFGYLVHSESFLLLIAFFAGAGVAGSTLLLGAVATSVYPTRARSTGVGWALGIGRFGSISSPIIGGAMLAAGMGIKEMYSFAAIPALVCAGSIFVLWRITKNK